MHWLQHKKTQLSARSHFGKKNQEKPPKCPFFKKSFFFGNFSWFFSSIGTLQSPEVFWVNISVSNHFINAIKQPINICVGKFRASWTVLLFYLHIYCSADMNKVVVYHHFILSEFIRKWMFSTKKNVFQLLLICMYTTGYLYLHEGLNYP